MQANKDLVDETRAALLSVIAGLPPQTTIPALVGAIATAIVTGVEPKHRPAAVALVLSQIKGMVERVEGIVIESTSEQ